MLYRGEEVFPVERLFSSFRRFVFTVAILASFFAMQAFYALNARECFSSNLLGTASGSGAVLFVSEISGGADSSALHSAGSRLLSQLRPSLPCVHLPVSAIAARRSEFHAAARSSFSGSADDLSAPFLTSNIVLLI